MHAERDRGAQPVLALPLLHHGVELAEQLLRRAYRRARQVGDRCVAEARHQRVVVHRHALAAVRRHRARGVLEELVGERQHALGIEHLRHAREIAQLGDQDHRLGAHRLLRAGFRHGR